VGGFASKLKSILSTEEATFSEDFFSLIPTDMLRHEIGKYLGKKEVLTMSLVSKNHFSLFKEPREKAIELAQLAYLRRHLLRLENNKATQGPNGCLKLESTDQQSSRFCPTVHKQVRNILDLNVAYENYFKAYLAMYQQYENSGGYCYEIWPSDSMEEFNVLFKTVQEKETALPKQLIQGTALGILQATAEYLNTYSNMKNNNELNGDTLDDLAVKGIGGAQLAAGEDIYDLYFRGEAMDGESNRGNKKWADGLKTQLGTLYFLFIWNGKVVEAGFTDLDRGVLRRRGACCCASPDSLSLIKVLTPGLNHSLKHEVGAEETNQAPTPS